MSQDIKDVIKDQIDDINTEQANKPERQYMTAFRKDGDSYRETEVDVSLATGKPLLPPDTTIQPFPDVPAGYGLTVEGDQWSLILLETEALTKDEISRTARNKFDIWSVDYLAAPFIHNDIAFHGDEASRNAIARVGSAVASGQDAPDVWVAYDGNEIEAPSKDFITELSKGYYQNEQERRSVIRSEKAKLAKVNTMEALEQLTFPSPETVKK